jgi:hypothetical protein
LKFYFENPTFCVIFTTQQNIFNTSKTKMNNNRHGGHSCNFRENAQRHTLGYAKVICECNGNGQISKQSCDSKLCTGCWVKLCDKNKWNTNFSECLNMMLMERNIKSREFTKDNFHLLIHTFRQKVNCDKKWRHISDAYQTIIRLKETKAKDEAHIQVELAYRRASNRMEIDLRDSSSEDEEEPNEDDADFIDDEEYEDGNLEISEDERSDDEESDGEKSDDDFED